MDTEKWITIADFPNYQVSNCGNVKNQITNKLMKLQVKCGYCKVSLVNKNSRNGHFVHRLVALEFLDNPENKTDVNHKDKNKTNNNLSNLEWMTRQENNIHRCKGIKITSNKKKPILRIDSNTNQVLDKYNSIELAGIWAFTNGLTKSPHNGRNAIGNCVCGLSNKAYNFKWQYENTNEDCENEIWKEVILQNNNSTDKHYFVSSLGRYKNSFGVISSNYKIHGDYMRVYINNKTYRIHRLVALAFLENPENKEQVNHLDGNKLNNCVSNLEWATNQENQIHKYQTGLGNNFTRKIIQFDLEMNKIKEFNSIVVASIALSIGKSNILGVLRNYRKTAGGFVFKYLEDYN